MRHRHLAGLISVVALFACSGCMPAKFTEIPALKGRVVGLDGRPMPGAVVEVSRKQGTPGRPFDLRVTTDVNGEFTYGGEQRWVLWILLTDVFSEVVQIRAPHGSGTSEVRDVEYRTEVGLAKPRHHDAGELRVPGCAPSP